jgi:hypothetical protein
MAIYEFTQTGINALERTTFSSAGMHERRDLQRLLRENVEVIAPGALVISEEFGEWEDSRRRIDLLAIDKEDANLVVIELKRTEDGGHMELQAIRYAAMVHKMTFDKAVDVFGEYLKRLNKDQDPRRAILEFLGRSEPNDDEFAQDVRIVLASAEFSKEVTSSVLWLNEHGMDIRCVRLSPYNLDGRILADVQQIIPLPEAAEYQVQIREKAQKEREERTQRAALPRMAELMAHGIIKTGDKLTIKDKPNSEATVVDAKKVKYHDREVGFNEWGTSVTGWPSINIYDWAVNEKGETLSKLREAYIRDKQV